MENNQKIADKKKADYQDTLQKNRADSAEQICDSYMKDGQRPGEKSCTKLRKLYLIKNTPGVKRGGQEQTGLAEKDVKSNPAKQAPANNVWTIHWHADNLMRVKIFS